MTSKTLVESFIASQKTIQQNKLRLDEIQLEFEDIQKDESTANREFILKLINSYRMLRKILNLLHQDTENFTSQREQFGQENIVLKPMLEALTKILDLYKADNENKLLLFKRYAQVQIDYTQLRNQEDNRYSLAAYRILQEFPNMEALLGVPLEEFLQTKQPDMRTSSSSVDTQKIAELEKAVKNLTNRKEELSKKKAQLSEELGAAQQKLQEEIKRLGEEMFREDQLSEKYRRYLFEHEILLKQQQLRKQRKDYRPRWFQELLALLREGKNKHCTVIFISNIRDHRFFLGDFGKLRPTEDYLSDYLVSTLNFQLTYLNEMTQPEIDKAKQILQTKSDETQVFLIRTEVWTQELEGHVNALTELSKASKRKDFFLIFIQGPEIKSRIIGTHELRCEKLEYRAMEEFLLLETAKYPDTYFPIIVHAEQIRFAANYLLKLIYEGLSPEQALAKMKDEVHSSKILRLWIPLTLPEGNIRRFDSSYSFPKDFENIPPGKRKIIFIKGGTRSGKTTTMAYLLQNRTDPLFYLNPEIIKQLPQADYPQLFKHWQEKGALLIAIDDLEQIDAKWLEAFLDFFKSNVDKPFHLLLAGEVCPPDLKETMLISMNQLKSHYLEQECQKLRQNFMLSPAEIDPLIQRLEVHTLGKLAENIMPKIKQDLVRYERLDELKLQELIQL